MLTHIVCWKYKPETTVAEREEHIAKLRNLPSVITDMISFNVGSDVLHLDRSYDTGLVAVYRDRASLDAYTDHPLHQEAAAFGRTVSAHVVSVDFVSETD